ncbi:MAG: glucose-6-phosphate dehydrogenase [Patescibacteria group bacterium]
MELAKSKKPFVLTIFGASGDLARLKIFPSLYSLMEQKKFPKDFFIVGFARTKKSDHEFQKEFEQSVIAARKGNVNKKLLTELVKHVKYVTGNYKSLGDFESYYEYRKNLTGTSDVTHIAYFSVPPNVFKSIIKNLGKTKESRNEDVRLVIEKPFGKDVASATELFHYVARYFDEEQVYLLDHYLGKSSVQSILPLRHANRFLNLIMKGPEVANIQITAFEDIGVADRVGYFDQVGTLRDMVQSHLLQVLALIAMSIPITEHAASLHREKYSILSALKFLKSRKNVVLGQYQSYRRTKYVPAGSKTETFAALRLFVDRESWYKVPIYLRTGKMLHEKHTYIVVELKKFAFQTHDEPPNRIIIELAPEEKISITLVNQHGKESHYQRVASSGTIACDGDDCLPEHGLLLLDVMRDNRINFLSFQEIIASWQLVDSIVRFKDKSAVPMHFYKDHGEGPDEHHELTKIDGFEWFDWH